MSVLLFADDSESVLIQKKTKMDLCLKEYENGEKRNYWKTQRERRLTLVRGHKNGR